MIFSQQYVHTTEVCYYIYMLLYIVRGVLESEGGLYSKPCSLYWVTMLGCGSLNGSPAHLITSQPLETMFLAVLSCVYLLFAKIIIL